MSDSKTSKDNIPNEEDYINPRETRLLQHSESAIKANHQKLQRLGVYNIVKVSKFSAQKNPTVRGYLTLITEISGKTAAQIQKALGLPAGFLDQGADIYRLSHIPGEKDILPRGYTSMPDGLHLKDELQTDANGYPRGQMAWQVTLRPNVRIPAILLATIQGNSRFDPGVHPRMAALYPEGHPVRAKMRK